MTMAAPHGMSVDAEYGEAYITCESEIPGRKTLNHWYYLYRT